jgi:hypothetical protein
MTRWSRYTYRSRDVADAVALVMSALALRQEREPNANTEPVVRIEDSDGTTEVHDVPLWNENVHSIAEKFAALLGGEM